jgi:hypothetical protein
LNQGKAVANENEGETLMFERVWFIVVCFPLFLDAPYGKEFDPRSYHWSTTARCSQEALPVQARPPSRVQLAGRPMA